MPAAQQVDGVSIAPLLERTGRIADRPLFWHYPHYSNQGGRPGGAVCVGQYRLVEFFEDEHVELYDLAADGGENRDLADDQPQRAAEMRRLLAEWRRSVDAQMPTVNPSPVDPLAPAPSIAPKRRKRTKRSGRCRLAANREGSYRIGPRSGVYSSSSRTTLSTWRVCRPRSTTGVRTAWK